jgi:hypothetical protein
MCTATKSCLFAGAFFFIVGTMEVLNSAETFGAFVLTFSLMFLIVGIITSVFEDTSTRSVMSENINQINK